ncbi:MAG: VWA domain-containing protein, partial [Elusimicrobiaceae bacterium]|nr:VWA domain-containing protein [Elusimicrobiaceae bacterium]
MSFIENFHFLRPLWLIALIGLFLIPNILRLYGNSGSAWKNICDSHLLDVLLTHQKARTAKLSIAALVAAYILSILALSGPTWERMPSQGATGGDNTVFVLDMGVDMGAGDVNPSRLDRAKYKLYDLLKKIKGDRAALVLFDNEGYMVSPLSEDLSVI